MPSLPVEPEIPEELPSPSTLALMRSIDFEDLSLCHSASCSDTPALNSITTRVHAHNQPLSPPVVPAQAALALLWLSLRTGDASLANADTDFFSAVRSGAMLCAAVNTPAVPLAPLTSPDIPATRNIIIFLVRVRRLGVTEKDLFDPDDLLLQRDLPKVIRTLAAVSKYLPPSFSALASRVPGSRAEWTVDDEPDETWEGDQHVRQLIRGARPQKSLGIVVAGPQGSGKSETATALLGRTFAPATPRLAVELSDACFGPREAARRQRARCIRAQTWPARPWETGAPLAETRVQKLVAKIDGAFLSVWEMPATDSRLDRHDNAGAEIRTLGAEFSKIQRSLQGGLVDAVLLVARSDLFQQNEFASACAEVHRLFGSSIWERVVIVLTHAEALPPSDVKERNYWIRSTAEAVRAVLKRFCGPFAQHVQFAPLDTASGSGIAELASSVLDVIEKTRSGEKIVALPLKRWWEDYVLGAFAIWAITRI